MKPRDHHIADRIGLVRLARLFSNVFSPPALFAAVALALAWAERPFWPGLAWAAVYGFFVSLAPMLFVLYLLHTGRIVELHMSDTTERHLPYLVAMVGSLLTVALLWLFRGPELLRALAWINILTLLLLALINNHWLISFHATAAMAMLLVIWLVFGPLSGLLLLPLVILIVAVRLYLRRHTPAQVVGGLLLGSVVVLAPAWLGLFPT